METTFLAKSSSGGEPYTVTFTESGGKLSVKCDCGAGRFGKFCKHKMGLIQGKDHFLAETEDIEDQIDKLHAMEDKVQASGLLPIIIEMSKARRKKEEAEEELKAAQKKMAQAMKEGA